MGRILTVAQTELLTLVRTKAFIIGILLMPGPTLLLMLMLAVPYLIFLHGQEGRRISITRMVTGLAVSAVLVGIAVIVGSSIFAERIAERIRYNRSATVEARPIRVIVEALERTGLECRILPASVGTPLSNVLILAERPALGPSHRAS